MNTHINPHSLAAIAAVKSATAINSWTPWLTPARFIQGDLNKYVEVTGDRNPIHQPSNEGPAVVPGMLSVSALPRYLEGRPPIHVNEHRLIFHHLSAEFRGIIFVGDEVTMQYLIGEPVAHPHGATFECLFRIRATYHSEISPAVIGSSRMILMGSEKYLQILRISRSRRERASYVQ